MSRAEQLLDSLNWTYKEGSDQDGSQVLEEVETALGSIEDVETPAGQFRQVCEYFSQEVAAVSDFLSHSVEAHQRSEKAQKVNNAQQKFLEQSAEATLEGSSGMFYRGLYSSKLFPLLNMMRPGYAHPKYSRIDISQSQRRKLILYYRGNYQFYSDGLEGDDSGLVDPVEFAVMSWLLDKYVREGGSPLFTEARIMSRHETDYPRYITSPDFAPNLTYKHLTDLTFIANSSLESNMVHFTHGSPEQIYLGSVTALGQPIKKDKTLMDELDRLPTPWVEMQLDYDQCTQNPRDNESVEIKDQKGSIVRVMLETIRMVKALEETAIVNAEKILSD